MGSCLKDLHNYIDYTQITQDNIPIINPTN